MTESGDRQAEGTDQKGEIRPRQPEDTDDLDAEIVQDLEVGEQGDNVRGGCYYGSAHPT